MATLRERFLARVVWTPEGHWLWQGAIDKQGYGRIRRGGRHEPVTYAHVVAYELFVGPIPDGLVIDHVCRVRSCVAPHPRHLEAVTTAENINRGESPTIRLKREGRCAAGHPASESYRRRSTGAVVYCKPCRRAKRERERVAAVGH